MELIQWSLNAIDTIFSTRRLGSEEPGCPDGTFAAGYTADAWGKWHVVCLAALSIEDVEDIILFGFMIAGFLLIGLSIALLYRKVCRIQAAVQSPITLPVLIDSVARSLGAQTVAISRENGSIMEKLADLRMSMDRLRGHLDTFERNGREPDV